MGKKFYDVDVPEFISAINKHTKEVEKQTEALYRQTQLVEKLLEKMGGVFPCPKIEEMQECLWKEKRWQQRLRLIPITMTRGMCGLL